jgi:hypothetical protein
MKKNPEFEKLPKEEREGILAKQRAEGAAWAASLPKLTPEQIKAMDERHRPVLAFISDSDSKVAWVFGPGDFSAVRSLVGAWSSPAPKVKAGDFTSDGGYDRLSDADAIALSEEAREEIKNRAAR